MNAQAYLRIILLIFLKSSFVLAREFCHFHGKIVKYCPTGHHCCSSRKNRCCRDKARGFSLWAIVFISVVAFALLVAGVYLIYKRLKSRRNRAENGVARSIIHAVPVQNAALYPQGQQHIATVFSSYPRQEILVNDGNLPPPYPTDDLPPPYPDYTKA